MFLNLSGQPRFLPEAATTIFSWVAGFIIRHIAGDKTVKSLAVFLSPSRRSRSFALTFRQQDSIAAIVGEKVRTASTDVSYPESISALRW